jgi:hypothetical protein
MSKVLWFVISIFSLVTPIVLSIFFYLIFQRRVLANKLSPALACRLLRIVSLVFPFFSLFFTTLIASTFYDIFPALLPASHDVVIPGRLLILFYLSLLVSIVSGSITLAAMR